MDFERNIALARRTLQALCPNCPETCLYLIHDIRTALQRRLSLLSLGDDDFVTSTPLTDLEFDALSWLFDQVIVSLSLYILRLYM